MNPTTLNAILKLLDLITIGLTLTPVIQASYQRNRALVQQMVDEGRDPTPDEWEALLSDIQENTNELNKTSEA